jgi:hypothetical protein
MDAVEALREILPVRRADSESDVALQVTDAAVSRRSPV